MVVVVGDQGDQDDADGDEDVRIFFLLSSCLNSFFSLDFKATVTLDELKRAPSTGFELINPKKKETKKGYKNSGALVVNFCEVIREHSVSHSPSCPSSSSLLSLPSLSLSPVSRVRAGRL